MGSQSNTGDPWSGFQKILDMFGGNAKTNAQIYRNGPEAMRAWLATGSRLTFDQWLKAPATIMSEKGESHT